jgi:hypothetical protein
LGRLEGRGIEKGRKVEFRGTTERGTAELLQRRHVQSAHGARPDDCRYLRAAEAGHVQAEWKMAHLHRTGATTAPEVLENRTWVAVLDRPP